jgi:hypothetical protein
MLSLARRIILKRRALHRNITFSRTRKFLLKFRSEVGVTVARSKKRNLWL